MLPISYLSPGSTIQRIKKNMRAEYKRPLVDPLGAGLIPCTEALATYTTYGRTGVFVPEEDRSHSTDIYHLAINPIRRAERHAESPPADLFPHVPASLFSHDVVDHAIEGYDFPGSAAAETVALGAILWNRSSAISEGARGGDAVPPAKLVMSSLERFEWSLEDHPSRNLSKIPSYYLYSAENVKNREVDGLDIGVTYDDLSFSERTWGMSRLLSKLHANGFGKTGKKDWRAMDDLEPNEKYLLSLLLREDDGYRLNERGGLAYAKRCRMPYRRNSDGKLETIYLQEEKQEAAYALLFYGYRRAMRRFPDPPATHYLQQVLATVGLKLQQLAQDVARGASDSRLSIEEVEDLGFQLRYTYQPRILTRHNIEDINYHLLKKCPVSPGAEAPYQLSLQHVGSPVVLGGSYHLELLPDVENPEDLDDGLVSDVLAQILEDALIEHDNIRRMLSLASLETFIDWRRACLQLESSVWLQGVRYSTNGLDDYFKYRR